VALKKGNSKGFTLIETIIAMLILLITVMSLAAAVVWGTKAMSAQGRKGDAVFAAQQEIETALVEQSPQGTPYEIVLNFGGKEVHVSGKLKTVEKTYRGENGEEKHLQITVFMPDRL